MRTAIPFHHSDISALAKSLRNALLLNNIDTLKHTDVLNLLARSKGFNNFQAFKAVEPISSAEHLIVLKAVPNSLQELFERDPQGDVIDRRHRRVESLIFRLNVSIVLGKRCADIVVHARGTGKDWSFDRGYVPSKRRIWQATLSELAKQLQNNNARPFDRQSVSIGMPKHGTKEEEFHDTALQDSLLNAVAFSSVERTVHQINQASHECKTVITWLMNIAKSSGSAVDNRIVVGQALDYIDAVVEASGEPHMYSWNKEKMSSIRHYLIQWSSGKGWESDGKDYVFRNLHLFQAPLAWTAKPPALVAYLSDQISKLSDHPMT